MSERIVQNLMYDRPKNNKRMDVYELQMYDRCDTHNIPALILITILSKPK